jgi:glutaryl-CoA dehydrogenase
MANMVTVCRSLLRASLADAPLWRSAVLPRKASSLAAFNHNDALNLESRLTEDEKLIRDSANQYCQEQLMPRVVEGFRHEKFDKEIYREMGQLGLLGPTIKGYGCPGGS